MIHDCIVAQPLTEIPIDSEGEFVELDVAMDDSDEYDEHEERLKGLMLSS